jgi:pSer/pThr/pTyr-binding forkhead associated (FHA) protein
LRGYLAALFERLRTTDSQLQAEINRRAPEDAVNADATVGDVSVSIESRYTGKAAEQLSPIKQAIEHFPYRIGRKISKGMTPFVLNELEVEDLAPYNISRNHCSIEIDGRKVCLRDRGSALGTIVNQHPINVREGTVVWELRDGENEIIFGNERSPQRFIVTVGRG